MENIRTYGIRASEFAKDVENEAKRITWPSRDEAIKSTLAVIVISAVFAAFLGLVDYLFSMVVSSILS